ncbi:hypothetical protein Poly21_04700 [Allorhodopirellula heiligendammensis]|uniref:Gfo/Idh/MocA-like oxidoreductase N-terminal domain-containing protein n=2 Tax=Allorhodopirellula heiligendammensis TaxID=2714739 RepID=A0A5C6C2E6_9BACT|nr:hypothetical protein Poly21_04700 [Allorhodopirellula heiligendammensis]
MSRGRIERILKFTFRCSEYTAEMNELGVEITDSMDTLLERVEMVLLKTNDDRPHLEQVLAVLKAGMPIFIDKPVAGAQRSRKSRRSSR